MSHPPIRSPFDKTKSCFKNVETRHGQEFEIFERWSRSRSRFDVGFALD